MAAKTTRRSSDGLLCPRGHVAALNDLYTALRLNEEDVLSVLVGGSHLWQTCTTVSDWDVYIVVKESGKASRDADGVKRNKSSKFDGVILSDSEFRSMLDGFILQYVFPLWSPDESCVRKKDYRRCFQLDREKLRGQLAETVSRDMKVAKKHFEKCKPLQSKKVICHCLQYVRAVDQILTLGEVQDYTACNTHRADILSCAAHDWEELEAAVKSCNSPPSQSD